jgi:hypothetical protein
MKKSVIYLMAAIGLSLSFNAEVAAQKREPVQPVGCMDATLRAQAAEIKQHYVDQGFVVFRDAMINMSSMEPFPVMVQLAAGHLYQIVFVGQAAATNHKIEIFDGADHKLDEKFISRSRDRQVSNYIVYEFVPERTDMYLFTFMTRLKNRDFCGSVSILAADQRKQKLEYKPYLVQ